MQASSSSIAVPSLRDDGVFLELQQCLLAARASQTAAAAALARRDMRSATSALRGGAPAGTYQQRAYGCEAAQRYARQASESFSDSPAPLRGLRWTPSLPRQQAFPTLPVTLVRLTAVPQPSLSPVASQSRQALLWMTLAFDPRRCPRPSLPRCPARFLTCLPWLTMAGAHSRATPRCLWPRLRRPVFQFLQTSFLFCHHLQPRSWRQPLQKRHTLFSHSLR